MRLAQEEPPRARRSLRDLLPAPRAAALLVSALLIPVLWVGFDLVSRGPLFSTSDPVLRGTYAAGAVLSLLVWGLAMETARHPWRSVRAAALALLGIIAAFGIGLQGFARAFTSAYVGRRALMLALGVPSLLHANYFAAHLIAIGSVCLIPAAIAVTIAVLRARRFGRLRARPWITASATVTAVLVVMFAPFAAQRIQALPPDMLWINAVGGPVLYAAGLARKPRSLPVGQHPTLPTVNAVNHPPSIVLILGESVRRDAVCLRKADGCAKSPRVDEAAPDRIGFARAYSIASCTELASTALWTGRSVTEAPDRLARAPLLWDYAKARGYRTAYITSQNLLYQQADLFLRGSHIDLIREARDRAVDAPILDGSPDEDAAAEALAFIAQGGPAFVVLHHANTHAPYRQAPGFTPYPTDASAGGEAQRNRYKNSLVHDDHLLGDFLTRLRETPEGRRAIVIFTSDHGEAWGEHHSFTHSFDLYAEQIDIPLWIDAPRGSLPDEADARLRRDAPTRPVATDDIAATVIDLLGSLTEPAFRDPIAALSGTSLLREGTPRQTLLWNCPPTRECAAEAFGVIAYPLKLHYVGHDTRYACHDIEADPEEAVALPEARCQALRAIADRTFGARLDVGGAPR